MRKLRKFLLAPILAPIWHLFCGMLMAAGVTKGTDTIQVGAIEPLFQIHPPRPDGTSFALAPDGERILVWSNKQQQTETVVNLVVNWPVELAAE